MTFWDAINWARADQDRKIMCSTWEAGTWMQWYTTSEGFGFKQQDGSVVEDVTIADILSDWQKVE